MIGRRGPAGDETGKTRNLVMCVVYMAVTHPCLWFWAFIRGHICTEHDGNAHVSRTPKPAKNAREFVSRISALTLDGVLKVKQSSQAETISHE